MVLRRVDDRCFGFSAGCIRRTEVESALAGARLVSETILCLSFSEDDFKGKVMWQLPSDLVPHVDKVVALHGAHVVEVSNSRNCAISLTLCLWFRTSHYDVCQSCQLLEGYLHDCFSWQQVVLQTLARLQLLETLRDALADVVYGLCMRYPGETRTHMEVVVNAKDFPARKGVLKLSDKQTFILGATSHPVHPRRKFQGGQTYLF